MSFLIYFFVLLVSAASVMFGLDLMNAPLPRTPNVPIGRPAQVAVEPPAQDLQRLAADEHVLTSVYPTMSGAPQLQAQSSGAATQEDAKLIAPPAPPSANTIAQLPAEFAPPNSEPVPIPQPAARRAKPQLATRQASSKGELRDVKRQPLDLQPPQSGSSKVEMSETERIVRHMTRNENADISVQDADGKIIIVRKIYR
jgi:hypothetical protein